MDGYMESGPTQPRTEEEKIGEALYSTLKRTFGEDNCGYLANGNPRVVVISFSQPNVDRFMVTPFSHFYEDAQNLIDSYGINTKATTISYGGDGVHTFEIIIAPN